MKKKDISQDEMNNWFDASLASLYTTPYKAINRFFRITEAITNLTNQFERYAQLYEQLFAFELLVSLINTILRDTIDTLSLHKLVESREAAKTMGTALGDVADRFEIKEEVPKYKVSYPPATPSIDRVSSLLTTASPSIGEAEAEAYSIMRPAEMESMALSFEQLSSMGIMRKVTEWFSKLDALFETILEGEISKPYGVEMARIRGKFVPELSEAGLIDVKAKPREFACARKLQRYFPIPERLSYTIPIALGEEWVEEHRTPLMPSEGVIEHILDFLTMPLPLLDYYARTRKTDGRGESLFELNLPYKNLNFLVNELIVSDDRGVFSAIQHAEESRRVEQPGADETLSKFEELRRRVEAIERIVEGRDILVNEARFKELVERIAEEYRYQYVRGLKFDGG